MTNKITKTMRFNDIAALLKGENAPNGTDVPTALDFIAREVELLAKKNAAKSDKPTATQVANEAHKSLIVAFLSGETEGKTCTEIAVAIPELAGFNNQKVAALLRQLVLAGSVTKTTVKGKSLFSIAEGV